MKIGIDIRNIGKKRTGDEVVFFNLVKNLATIDNKNNYQLFTDITDTEILTDIKNRLGIGSKNNFEIIPLKTANRFTWNFWTLPKHLRQNPADIYLTQYITPWFVPKKIKIATVVHDISFNFYAKYIKFSDLFFLKLLIPVSLRRADKIIAVSRFTRDEIIKYYKIAQEKVEWIQNAVAESFLEEITADKSEPIRKKYNLPEKFILYVGTLQPRKNLPLLINAYAKIKEKIPGIKLVLAGNKSGHNFDTRINEAIRTNSLEGEVLLPGFIGEDDKPQVFKLAKIFCFPSLYEGFGIPILEAMSQGIPTVVSDIPAHREVAGDAALYFDAGTLDDFSEKMYNALIDENLRRKLSNSGLERVRIFSWRKTAEKILEIFETL